MRDGKNKLIQYGVKALLLVTLFFLCIVLYNRYIYMKISQTMYTTLNEVITQQAFHFTSRLESDNATLEIIASEFSTVEHINDLTVDRLQKMMNKTAFDFMAVVTRNGTSISSDGLPAESSDVVQRSFVGETAISEPIYSASRGEDIIVVSTPLIADGTIPAVLVGSYLVEELNQLFFPSFDGKGYAYIVNNEGQIIAKTTNAFSIAKGDNIFEVLEAAVYEDGDHYAMIHENIHKDEAGRACFTYQGQKRILQYRTIHVNSWNIFSLVPEEVILQDVDEITRVTFIASLMIIAFLLFVVLSSYRLQKKNLRRIQELAFVDDLTQAPTRVRFLLEAQRFIDAYPNKKLLMVKFDVDRFKLVNQILGKEIGDQVLINLSKALKVNTPGKYDRYARVHDDEYYVLHEYEQPEDLVRIRTAFQQIFRQMMGPTFEYNIRIVSGHYYMTLQNCRDASLAMERANIAHRKAKQCGLDIYVYDETLIKEALLKKDIEDKMQHALDTEEFKLFLQPQYSLHTESVVGAESLVRWQQQDGSMIYPNEFIPVLEENGFITNLDLYMFRKTCALLQNWIELGIEPLVISVNFSRKHLSNTHFVEQLCQIADSFQVEHRFLGVELTEGMFFDNEAVLLDVLDKLHAEQFTLLMDDFGTGYSSLGLLKSIPVDVIKIDRSFFVNMDDGNRAQVVLSNVLRMAKELKIQTVAEGVETREIVELLQKFGCDIAQGYYYARPMSAAAFTDRLQAIEYDLSECIGT